MIIRKRIILIILLLISAITTFAQDNNKILNRPYADMKLFHFGFSVGIHTQDLNMVHNGYVAEDGSTWFMDVPSTSPGFCVNVLADMRISTHFNLRVSPGMYFGNKVIKMYDTTNGVAESQNYKTNYIVLPVDLKISALRYKNIRPYVTTGVMGTFDVSKRTPDILMFNSADMMFTIGFGCDIYMHYFKLIPELKFCLGLTDILDRSRPDLEDDPTAMYFTNSLSKVTSNMVVLTFYFE
ncbi:MAG: porin family protein [Bacteroidales bacterium]